MRQIDCAMSGCRSRHVNARIVLARRCRRETASATRLILGRCACEHRPAFLAAAPQKVLVKRANPLICLFAQIARACGRVSIGGDPDKRPVNRRQKSAAGGEPANPAKRGTRLKATTDRAFSSLPASKPGLPKRLVFLAGRAERESIPSPSEGHEVLNGVLPCEPHCQRRSIWRTAARVYSRLGGQR